MGFQIEIELLAVAYAYFERLFSPLTPGNLLEEFKKSNKMIKELIPEIAEKNKNEGWDWLKKITQTPFTPKNAKSFQKARNKI